jgi:hypothetical protein
MVTVGGEASRSSATVHDMSPIHDLSMASITGEAVDFDRFRDQVLVVVNVASA